MHTHVHVHAHVHECIHTNPLHIHVHVHAHTYTDPITISQCLQEQIVAPNTYTCKISGVPPPTIKWTFNGEEISKSSSIHIENNTTALQDIVMVTSTLLYLSSHESGQVACIGYHMEGGRLVTVTSEAHLIVLSKDKGIR